jgi:hypothetical protein
VSPNLRTAIAGAAAATVWTAYDPLLRRLFGTPYADSELLGPFITRGPLEPVANAVTHAAVGFAFGYGFALAGRRGVKDGVVAAVAENTALWPLMAVVDRVHPRRRDGEWPKLVTNPRAFAQATAGHALFGALLGILSRRA